MTANGIVLDWIAPGGFTDEFADPLCPDSLDIVVENINIAHGLNISLE
jgi:hypothetical protein